MNRNSFIFLDDFTAQQLIERLPALAPHCVITHQKGPCHYLDTLDWRLLKNDRVLIANQHPDHYHLQLYNLAQTQLLSHADSPQLPGQLNTLPPGKLRELLRPLLDIRGVVSQLSLQRDSQEISLQNAQQKTIARLEIEQLTSASPEPVTEARLWQQANRGYPKIHRQLTRHLAQLALVENPTPPLTSLLEQLGRPSQWPNNKLTITLDHQARCDESFKQLFRQFYQVMAANHKPILQDVDSECLHDYRVAIRRTRTLLGVAKDILPASELARFDRQFSQLGTLTTPLRDLDVMLLSLPDYRAALPPALRPHLDDGFQWVFQQRGQVLKDLQTHLRSRPHQQFIKGWQHFLHKPAPARTPLATARRPVWEVADELVWQRYRRILKQGNAITRQSPDDALHTVRKGCKKLRYLIEFFHSLYPGKRVKAVLVPLKQFQDLLGEFQDLHVHGDYLQQLLDTMTSQQSLDKGDRQALQQLIKVQRQQQKQCRKKFAKRFAQFASKAHQTQFKKLFKP